MKERDIDTEIKEVWKQLSDEKKENQSFVSSLPSARNF